MALRPEDSSLAAYLIREQLLSVETVIATMMEASTARRTLADALVHSGRMEQRALAQHLGRMRGDPNPGALDVLEPETWYDVPPSADQATETEPTSPVEEPKGGNPVYGGAAAAEIFDDFTDLDVTRPYGPDAPQHTSKVEEPGGATTRWSPLPELGNEGELEDDTRRPRALPSARDPGAVDVDLSRDAELSSSTRPMLPDERYQLKEEIGRGGMGRIMRARDIEIGRDVALKVLHGGGAAPENTVRRFWTEVQATGQLEHPAIIPIHDVGRLGTGELFYVMKRLSGRSLSEILEALMGPGEPDTADEFGRTRLLTVLQQIAYAVAFAHAHGVIHRDIKPANIMVGRFGEAILIDWGLAKMVRDDDAFAPDEIERPVEMVGAFSGSNTATGMITGTPQYMSPEATEGDPSRIGPKADVYGLGAVLYELLARRPAFEDLGFVPTVMKVRARDFVPPTQIAPEMEIPQALEQLCLRAMAAEPRDRPSAKVFADELGRILDGARERERRQREAKERVREGRAAIHAWKRLKRELQGVESEVKLTAKVVPPHAPVSAKQALWRLEDKVSDLKVEAVGAFESAEAAFLRALGEVPEDRDARAALTSLYFARFVEAELARDREGQRYFRQLVARYDNGAWARVLDGDGTLEITASHHDVEVSIARLEPEDRVLVPRQARNLGRVPVARFRTPLGSYQLRFRRGAEAPIVRPVVIARAQSVQVSLRYRSPEAIGDGFVYIPAGTAIVGGDPVAHGAFERRVVELPDFAIARFPVTCDEYLAFLDALAREDLDQANRHVPRARAREGHWWTYDDHAGRFRYPKESPGGHRWVGDLAVNGVSFEDAQAYIRWRKELTGERLRLPSELEWEKAARGVDGRFFPWGDHFDPTFCKMKSSRDVPYPEPEPVGTFPVDTSPYGARDMAGGVRELCTAEVDGEVTAVMRGGCWHDTGLFCRVAFRHVTQPDFVNSGLGFRLAKDFEEASAG